MQENTPRWLIRFVILLSGVLVLAWSPTRAFPQTQTLSGEVLNEKNVPISGALCTLSGGSLPEGGLSRKTGLRGEFRFRGLMGGTYHITCAAEGYEPVAKAIQLTGGSSQVLQVFLPAEIVIRQRVEVREKAPTISQQQAAPATTFSSAQLLTLPGVEQKFKAALPLVPGIIRTPDGKLNIKGVPENQSLLLVNSAEAVDPVTGSFAVDIPTIAIESLKVYKSPYRAVFGNFSGGLVSVQTKPPSDRWTFEVEDLTPNPRIKSGHLVGIADYNPRLYFTGPLVANRLNFSEAFAYDIDKQPVRGLAWPHNEIKSQEVNSFTSFQYVFSSHHLLTTNVHVFPLRRQFANINSLVPQTASSDYGQRGFSIGVTDHYLLGSGILTTLFQATKFDSYAHGQGSEDMLVTPNGWAGDFFNAYDRASNEEQVTQTYRFPRQEWHGGHEATVGATFIHRSYSGVSRSHPVLIQKADGTTAEKIDFAGAGSLAATDTEAAIFAQDHWALSDRLSLDAGLRYSGHTLGDWLNFGPRLGIVFSPGRSGKTILRGGVGVFYGQEPLLAGDFPHDPTRMVSFFNPEGIPQGPPIVFRNAYGQAGLRGIEIASRSRPETTPYNVTWSAQLDHEIRPNVVFRLSYLSSQSYDQFIVDPSRFSANTAALLLSNAGRSRYHELESTLHLRLRQDSELNVSYVHSRARGDLNSLPQIFVPFEQPVIRPNFYAKLPADVPNRFIAWGRFKTGVWGILATPVFDVHTGFPYSNVDVLQNYVGPPNGQRIPTFVALDLELGRNFHLPFPWLKKHLMYGELTVFNVTNHTNPRDVFNNITSPFFGHFVGFQHRSFDTSLNIIY